MLTQQEKIRRDELLEKYEANIFMNKIEVQELISLLKRDNETNEGLKLLALVALGMMLAYLLNEDSKK